MNDSTFESMLKDPQAHFDSPIEVVECEDLTNQQKIDVLKQWRYDAQLLMVAETENMAGGEKSNLTEIDKALRACGGTVPNDGVAS